jgi:hypothetical protein
MKKVRISFGVLLLCSFANLIKHSVAFSIPGLVPTNYKRGDKLPILAG